jgi:hypothetical protein
VHFKLIRNIIYILTNRSLRFYAVKFSVGSSASPEDGDVSRAEIRTVEEGLASPLEDVYTTHITCCLWCSCQWDRHKGGPCAHMQRVYLQVMKK